MIKLKDILKNLQEQYGKENSVSWQRPDGTFFPIKYSHAVDAPSHAKNIIGIGDYTTILWKAGWQRIASMATLLYAHNEIQPPNDKQTSKLIGLAMENNFKYVSWDGGEKRRHKILWARDDVLQESEEEEPTKERKSTSWLDESGNFIPVTGSHHSFAIRITGTADEPEKVLWKRGWLRITYYSRGTLYAENHIMPPNDIQERKLIDLVRELNFDELKYDNGKNRDIILWSKEDFLEQAK